MEEIAEYPSTSRPDDSANRRTSLADCVWRALGLQHELKRDADVRGVLAGRADLQRCLDVASGQLFSQFFVFGFQLVDVAPDWFERIL
jgi:hypothetical protein